MPQARVAAIECGVDSIQLLVADLPGADGQVLTEVARRFEPLCPRERLPRARAVLSDYAEVITALEVQKVRMCGIGADSSLVQIALDTLGITPESLDAAECARLSFAGAVGDLPGAGQVTHLVTDIGPHATQLALGASTVERSASVDLGCAAIAERYFHHDPPTEDEIEQARQDMTFVVDHALAAVPGWRTARLVGVSESVACVAAFVLGDRPGPEQPLHHAVITEEELSVAAAELLTMPADTRRALVTPYPHLADVLPACALAVQLFMQRAGQQRLVVSRHDILHGLARHTG
ncbi:exopolyphosphatase/guanosine-5'-triphosphate,3'-diphosphate pyrophosphatase [Crossiella equi]|uniref:Exopolyphosphatase/guanosine-5'-triphosphate, 3'-diphosphate pyrophosphatase n=1 Tax=Crossiella equi TaxID=130796 RepID=A0ABS5A9G1_9PSEU|nr:hypothetical protein [Crossiella equi]MBP2473208.1 exopolyphosphatase/guanosine-5'-triphosphate,3'-diphosphate pyrophosphatase [Crossiella equi]